MPPRTTDTSRGIHSTVVIEQVMGLVSLNHTGWDSQGGSTSSCQMQTFQSWQNSPERVQNGRYWLLWLWVTKESQETLCGSHCGEGQGGPGTVRVGRI